VDFGTFYCACGSALEFVSENVYQCKNAEHYEIMADMHYENNRQRDYV